MCWLTWLRIERSQMNEFYSKVWLSITLSSARSRWTSVIVSPWFLIRMMRLVLAIMEMVWTWLTRSGICSWSIFCKMVSRSSRKAQDYICCMRISSKGSCRISSSRSLSSWSRKSQSLICRRSSRFIGSSIWSRKNLLKEICEGRRIKV